MPVSPMRHAAIALLLTIIFGCCYASAQQETSESAAKRRVQKTRQNCDFSERRPLRMSSDWLWHGGIARRGEPTYPLDAKSKHIQGKVAVRILINGNGAVECACGVGPRFLLHAAEDAARQWVFRTPEINGETVAWVEESLMFDFVLHRPADPAP